MTSTQIDLTPYLDSIGLRINRVTGVEIQAWCPAHLERTGREDARPSFYFNQVKLIGHCYSCDWKVPALDVLVGYLTGGPVDQDVINEAKSYSLSDAVAEMGRRKRAVTDDRRVLQWKFRQLRPVPSQLLAFRKLSAAIAEHFSIRFDPDQHSWAIPIHTPGGVLMGWQLRQKGGVSNYPTGMRKSTTLFGMHLFDTHRLALVESPLDAARLFQCGIPAVASFGAAVSNAQIELLTRNCSEVVVALDNPAVDAAGREATPRVLSQLRKRVGAVPWRYEGKVKDPGDYRTDQEIVDAWRTTLRYGL